MKHFLILAIAALLSACTSPSAVTRMEQIDAEEAAGNFSKATRLIDFYIAENELSPVCVYELNVRKDLMHRTRLDFNKDRTAIVEYIGKYYPDVNDEMLSRWENANTLESMVIEGEKRYYSRAAPNLFRLDREAKARKAEIDTPAEDRSVLPKHLPEIIDELGKSGKTQASPVKMRVKYELTLKPNAVPDGETVRCWLPYPREDHRRQSNVQLLSVNSDHYVISPEEYAHRTIYMEKIARKDEPLTFAIEFSYRHAAEWFNIQKKDIQLYDTQSELYKTFTSERPPHVVFTDSIKAISQRILSNETDPRLKLKKLFVWINTTFPWAGAREYSTLQNIPQYVLENGHGDCGQVTLLLITLARYNGIPARWQSGFQMQPGNLNMHDWGEYYIEGVGWIPVDQSYGVKTFSDSDDVKYFYTNGIDAYRWIVNSDFSQPLFPNKIFWRSDDVDFQRGELEWRGGNIYYNLWNWDMDVTYE